MLAFRSLVFNFLFYAVTLIEMIVFTPFYFLAPRKRAWFVPRFWAKTHLWLMKIIIGTDHVVLGKENLPEGLFIVETVESRAFYRPWTYAHPFVERFVAVDQATVKTHTATGQKLADVYLFGRWAPVHKIPVLADCKGGRQAPLIDAVSFEEDGTVTGADWADMPENDPTQAAICGAN